MFANSGMIQRLELLLRRKTSWEVYAAALYKDGVAPGQVLFV